MGLYGVFETKDGHIALAGLGDPRWPTFVSLLGLEDVAADPRFLTGDLRKTNRAEVTEAVRPAIRRHTTRELIDMFDGQDIVFAPVQSYVDVLEDEQAAANGYVQRIPHGELGDVRVVGTPITVDGEVLPARGPAPELGQNTELVMSELGYSWEEISRIREAGGI
jgi:crotonobetainyl-CoA:carnitine CoA-transferase CaiB-like acyl-CoA transferase